MSPAQRSDSKTARTHDVQQVDDLSVVLGPFASDSGRFRIRILDGVSEPVKILRRDGKDYVLGFSCKPHDCGENALAFLAALDGSRAVVVMKSEERTEGRVEVYGASTPAERRLLKDVLLIPR